MKDKFKLLEDITYYLGMIVSLLGLILIYLSRRNLPDGACPIDNYRYILVIGIVLFVISLILGFVRGRKKKQ